MAMSGRGASRKHPFADAPVINPAQLGGIETSVLDDGPGRGLRIAWVNTGGGMRYKVMIDRGLDIADAEFLGQSLTWHSLGGPLVPSHAYTRGMQWLWGFYGGLMVSCGPLNTERRSSRITRSTDYTARIHIRGRLSSRLSIRIRLAGNMRCP